MTKTSPDNHVSIKDFCAAAGISRSTYYRLLTACDVPDFEKFGRRSFICLDAARGFYQGIISRHGMQGVIVHPDPASAELKGDFSHLSADKYKEVIGEFAALPAGGAAKRMESMRDIIFKCVHAKKTLSNLEKITPDK